jgi:hypothetical protein
MISNSIVMRRAVAGIAAALAILSAGGGAHAQVKLTAHYAISVAHIPIGEIDWTFDFDADHYDATASGHASGVLRVLASGEGTLEARGLVRDGALAPTDFAAKTKSEGDNADIKMVLDGGAVKELKASTPPASDDRVPITDAHRQGVIDPLSAMMIAGASSADVLSADACKRTLPVFDGRRRFDLALSFKRMDKVKSEKGYDGTVVVCAVTFKAIAGHRASSPLVKYLSDGRDIELWLAPIADTRLLAPFRLSVASMLGNLVVAARSFEVTAPARATIDGTRAD